MKKYMQKPKQRNKVFVKPVQPQKQESELVKFFSNAIISVCVKACFLNCDEVLAYAGWKKCK